MIRPFTWRKEYVLMVLKTFKAKFPTKKGLDWIKQGVWDLKNKYNKLNL